MFEDFWSSLSVLLTCIHAVMSLTNLCRLLLSVLKLCGNAVCNSHCDGCRKPSTQVHRHSSLLSHKDVELHFKGDHKSGHKRVTWGYLDAEQSALALHSDK